MQSEKKKYLVNVTKKYSDCGLMHKTECTPQVTYAVSKKQAESNIRHRIGRPIHPYTNSSDEVCTWVLEAEEVE